jgi:tetraacyldisaccharide 4'-kinase
MKYLRWLLLPFSLLYGLVVIIRNWCYDAGLLKSRSFNLPVICIGNLAAGGAGKSPMAEYIIRLLKDHYKLATLSRGYGRQTKGYLTATTTSTAAQIGDEPAQFKHKFPDITVAVCEKRVDGIEHLQNEHEVIILDDAFQHRAVKAGINIILFDYTRMHEPQLMLPAGNLREPMSGRWRAEVLIVSKCPDDLSTQQATQLEEHIAPLPYQQLFFTSISYQPLMTMDGRPANASIDNDTEVFLLTGIANPTPLIAYIGRFTPHIHHHNYPDHHRYSLKNIAKLADEFNTSAAQKKLIITTEKDAQRLGEHELASALQQLPVLVIPIGVNFMNGQGQQFDQLIQQYVRKYTTHNSIH